MAQSLVETILEAAAKNGATKVTEVNVTVGPFAMVEPEQLVFCFNLIIEDTIIKGADLNLHESKGILECLECGYKGEGKPPEGARFGIDIITCPKCGSVATRLIEGSAVFIETIKAEC